MILLSVRLIEKVNKLISIQKISWLAIYNRLIKCNLPVISFIRALWAHTFSECGWKSLIL